MNNTGSHNKREGRMSVRGGWRGRVGIVGLTLVGVAALAVSGSAFGKDAAESCGTVVINEQSWSGSTANTYVAKYVLEKRLGCKVKLTQVTEGPPYFQAMRDGKVDVALEDWDNTTTKQAQPYLKDGSVRIVGSNGITGVIGWYIPRYLLKQYPAFKTWRGLKGKETVFKSPESGSQGMFLGGDPSYVQKDRALIKELGLNFKHVVAGAEPAQVARWSQLYKQKKPVLFYWYDPQYLNAQYDLVRVQLPKRFAGCLDDEKLQRKARVRVPVLRARQADLEEVRDERLAGGQVRQALEVDVRRPELRRQPHLRQEAEAGEGSGAVGQGEPREGERLAQVARKPLRTCPRDCPWDTS